MKIIKVSIWIPINSENKILLQDRTGIAKLWEKWASFWGKLNKKETKEEWLEREIKEELNLEIKDYKYIKTKTFFFWKQKQIITINYFTSFIDLDIAKLTILEWKGAKYFSLDELDTIGFVEKWKYLESFKELIKTEIDKR